ncbi:hypothetical protein G7Y89_g9261 [Cudoniella acicularis]|uniref:CTLH domain-containing protein n=1 Tax=Cudoniella acicularis TaxID=354080 RepID=A0A8H4W2R9_9HELO|nr:hypothetical protein G7Y89_g9261 [Cudoniella acicularis]
MVASHVFLSAASGSQTLLAKAPSFAATAFYLNPGPDSLRLLPDNANHARPPILTYLLRQPNARGIWIFWSPDTLLRQSSTSGTPAEVVLADDRSQFSISSPSTSDDPSTSTHPSLPTSTTFSAQDRQIAPTQQTLLQHITPPNTAGSLQNPPQVQPASSATILGRRRRTRSPDSEDRPDIHESPRGSVNAEQAENEHRRKRRRQDPRMRAEGETASSNGTSRPFSNGSGASPLHKAAVSNSTNGMRKSPVATNGSSTNGHSSTSAKPRPPYFGHDREEVTRIMIQALTDMGYNGAAASLSQESGYELESPVVAAFRNAVLQGEWQEAEELLFDGSAEGGVSISGNGLVLQEGVDKNVMRFWLRQQKFLELLEQRDTGRALMVLRLELTPLYQDTAKLHFLSSLLMCQSTDDLKAKADWDGAEGGSRHQLLSELSKCISPSVMLPEHRLAILLHQVKKNQISNCLYHNTATSPSLYQDHACDRNNFPVHTLLELDKHTGEVWKVQFSHDGSRLASCGEDGTVIIYQVGSFEVLQTLADHEAGVGSLAWSPDDSMIVTCSRDRRARLWNSETGEIKRILNRFGEPVSSCVWAPDGQTFVTGCLDKERNLCQYNLNGELIYDWGRSHRIEDLAVSPNGHRLVAMSCDNHLHVYNFVTRELEYELDLKVQLSSVSISQNSRFLLVNTKDGQTRMLDLDTRESVRNFQSNDKGGTNVIRAGFGGANESFVITGSEAGLVYIWHKENGQLIETLEAHEKGCCNSVSWNPVNPCMFASAGDDHKVRIWSNEDPTLKSSKGSRQSNGSQRESNGW